MIHWENQREIKKEIDKELSALVCDESKLKEIFLLADMENNDFGEVRSMNRRSVRTIFKVSVIAAVITAVSVGAVFAYEYAVRKFWQPVPEKYKSHIAEAAPDAALHQVEVHNADEDIIVEWGEYTSTNHDVYVNVTIRSADGSPLVEENADRIFFSPSANIDTIYVTVDGEKKRFLTEKKSGTVDDSTMVIGVAGIDSKNGLIGVGCSSHIVDYAEDLSSLTFEICYQNYDMDLAGKDIVFELENVRTDYYVYENLGTDKTVAELIADADDGNRIYFSRQYPDCYIDGYEFLPDGSRYDGKNAFYMTIVCDEASKEELKNLVLQNTVTGYKVSEGSVVELEDGRLQLSYTVNWDAAYYNLHQGGIMPVDTDMSHLETVVMKKNCERTREMVAEGNWEASFMLEEEVSVLSSDMSVTVPSHDGLTGGVTVYRLELNGVLLEMDASVGEDYDIMKFYAPGRDYPVIYLKDGSTADIKPGIHNGGNNIRMHFSYEFVPAINPENVERIEWHGVTIWAAE